MNEKFEKYIEGLDPELQEKARACNSLEEVMELAAENDIELPEDALEAVSGGCGTESKPEIKYPYHKICGKRLENVFERGGGIKYKCAVCNIVITDFMNKDIVEWK
jgi:hypothetical protein